MEASNARQGQEGSRWVNYRPSGEEVAKWFEENVTLHEDALDHKHYVSGLTLIQQKQKEDVVVGFGDDGKPTIDEVTSLYYVPYAKVETRVKYFNDYMALHPEWIGLIESMPPPEPVPGLPEGFYRMVVTDAQGGNVAYVCCSMRVSVYEREGLGFEEFKPSTGKIQRVRSGKLVQQGAIGSKMVPVLGRYGPDANCLMKAETGAVGRALGLAGMLVVPGSGVATAEDVAEAQALEGRTQAAPGVTPETAVLPPEAGDDALRTAVSEKVETLKSLDPKRLEAFQAWCKERKFGLLSEATGAQMRGILRRLDKDIEEAQAEAQTAEHPVEQ